MYRATHEGDDVCTATVEAITEGIRYERSAAPTPEPTPAPTPAPPLMPIAEVTAPILDNVDTAQANQDEPGLSLRFASDRDFLRLVNKGEIQVFAFRMQEQTKEQIQEQAQNVLGLDRNFEFLSTEAPGQLYELLPETIPNLIVAALDRATPDARSYTWGVRMPKKLAGKIREFVDRAVHGELVIDRYGDVHHVAS